MFVDHASRVPGLFFCLDACKGSKKFQTLVFVSFCRFSAEGDVCPSPIVYNNVVVTISMGIMLLWSIYGGTRGKI